MIILNPNSKKSYFDWQEIGLFFIWLGALGLVANTIDKSLLKIGICLGIFILFSAWGHVAIYPIYYRNGNIYLEVEFKDGKYNGLYIGYYDNGKIHQLNPFKNGLRNGLFKYYYEDGNIWLEIEYKDDLKDGYRKQYNESNKLIKHEIYQDDELIEKIDLTSIN